VPEKLQPIFSKPFATAFRTYPDLDKHFWHNKPWNMFLNVVAKYLGFYFMRLPNILADLGK